MTEREEGGKQERERKASKEINNKKTKIEIKMSLKNEKKERKERKGE